jgi:hypothetical protein
MRNNHGTLSDGPLFSFGRVERPLRSPGTIVEILE